MSRFNPYAVEEVPFENATVSVFAGRGRYSGGVAGLGALAPLLMRKEWHGKCPSGFSPGPVAASGNQYCLPGVEQTGYKLSDKDDAYSSPPLVTSDPSEWASWPGSDSSGSGGGFFSSIFRNVARTVTGTAEQGESAPVKESSPWPWVVGGVAVLGLGALILTRRKK